MYYFPKCNAQYHPLYLSKKRSLVIHTCFLNKKFSSTSAITPALNREDNLFDAVLDYLREYIITVSTNRNMSQFLTILQTDLSTLWEEIVPLVSPVLGDMNSEDAFYVIIFTGTIAWTMRSLYTWVSGIIQRYEDERFNVASVADRINDLVERMGDLMTRMTAVRNDPESILELPRETIEMLRAQREELAAFLDLTYTLMDRITDRLDESRLSDVLRSIASYSEQLTAFNVQLQEFLIWYTQTMGNLI